MRYILKLLILLVILTHITLFAEEFKKPPYDKRLNQHQYGKIWYDTADSDYESAFNIGVFYRQSIKNNQLAEFWYKKSWNIRKDNDTANNLGYLYEDLKKYEFAKKWYITSIKLNNDYATYNLAMLYENHYQNYQKAVYWYEQSVKRKNFDATQNLSLLYHKKLNDNLKAVEYFLPLINHRYSKKKVMKFFKVKYKVDKKTIQKGYEAQLKSKIIPEKLKYKGGI